MVKEEGRGLKVYSAEEELTVGGRESEKDEIVAEAEKCLKFSFWV